MLDAYLRNYEEWFGQCVSKNKSRVPFPHNTSHISKRDILSSLGVECLKKDDRCEASNPH